MSYSPYNTLNQILNTSRYTCCGIALCIAILWPVLINWYLHIDFSFRIPTALLFLSFLLLYKDIKQLSFKTPLIIYCGIAIYMVINGWVMGSSIMYPKDGNWIIFVRIINPVLFMLITATLAQKNWDLTTKTLIFSTIVYCILALINSSIDTRDEYNRLNSEINANEMALVAGVTYGLLIMQSMTYNKKWIPRVLCIIPILLIMRTGSRMGLGIIIITTLFAIFCNSSQKGIKNIVIKMISIAIFTLISIWVLHHTMIGERLLSTSEQGETNTYLATNTIFDLYGDRGFQYYYSWPYFLEHPLCGIGFNQWKLYSPSNLISHSEYMVQYLECGLVSFIPYIIFLFLLIKNFCKSWKLKLEKQHNTGTILLSLLLALLYINTVMWTYKEFVVFIIYALCVAYTQKIQHTESKEHYNKINYKTSI